MKKPKDTDKDAKEVSNSLQVEDKFDSLYQSIISPESRKAADELFNATDKELNKAYNPQEKN